MSQVVNQAVMIERKIKIAASDTFDQGMQGNVLRVTFAPVPLRVRSRDGYIDMYMMEGERAVFPVDVNQLVLSHDSASDQFFKIQVGKGVEVLSAQVSGTVNVVNGEISRVQNGQCFIGKCVVSSAAAQYSSAQLWNPAGSGKKIVVTKVSLASVSVATVISLSSDSVILAGGIDGNIMNKNIGAAAAAARILSATIAALNPAPANIYIEQANKTVDYPFAEPILINPGYGLNMNSVAQNNAISCTLQWSEMDV